MVSQILKSTPATISASFYVDGTLADPGVVTVTVTKLDGTALYTDASTGGTGAASRTLALTTSDTAKLDTLTCVWTSGSLGDITTTVEVVGALLFTESEVRAFGDGELSDTDLYTDAALADARSRIAEQFEDICGVSFYPRYKREVLSGSGVSQLMLPDIRVSAVRSIETRQSGGSTWTAFTSTELADVFITPGGILYRESLGSFASGVQNIRVGYEYGHQRVPGEISRAAMMLMRDEVVDNPISDRASAYSDELGTYRFVTPGLTRGAVTTIPTVNEVLRRYSERVPGIA